MGGVASASVPTEGLYALETQVVTTSQVPVFGKNRVVTVTRALLEIAPRPSGLGVRQRTCSIDVESSSAARTVIPSAFVDTLPELLYDVTREGGQFRMDQGTQVVGLTEQLSELPRRGDDPAVKDTDGDGKPGATVRLEVPLIGSVDVYVVQQTRSVLTGRVEPGGAVGRVDVLSLDQRTVGASNPVFKATPRLSPVDGEGWFSLRPVQRGTTCSDL
jgi:hypothetical protein